MVLFYDYFMYYKEIIYCLHALRICNTEQQYCQYKKAQAEIFLLELFQIRAVLNFCVLIWVTTLKYN